MERRFVLAILLVGLAVSAGVHYDAAEERHWPYPTGDQLYDDYERHVGEEALLFGTVRSVDRDAGTAVVEVETGAGTFTVQVREFDAEVEPGGSVQVYGTLEDDRAMTVSNVVVVERTPGERLFKYWTSAVGAVLALAAFFRYWRIDPKRLTFEPR